MPNTDVARKVKLLLAARGLTQKDVAAQYDPPITPQSFGNKIKNNNFTTRDFEQISRICNAEYDFKFKLPDTEDEL